MTGKPISLAYFVTHPIQYQAPLLRMIAAEPSINLKVFFAADYSLTRHFDPGFGREIEWDVDLTDGYDYEILPALNPETPLSVLHPISYGVFWRILTGGFDAIWCHSYARPSHMMAILAARLSGKKVFLRDEDNLYSSDPPPARAFIKKYLLQIVNRLVHGVLTIGKMNREFYASQGFPDRKLFSMPYAVDNDWFKTRIAEAMPRQGTLRRELGIAPDQAVILFAAKFQPRKRGDDLIRAFHRIATDGTSKNACLVMVGDGEMDDAWRGLAGEALGKRIHFVGFKGMLELPAYFDLCDVFVIPSALEPWGLVLNEVLNAGKPVIVTDQVGSAYDLVEHGKNGFMLETGNIDQLSDALRKIIADPVAAQKMGTHSLEIIRDWSFTQDVEGLKSALRSYFPERVS